MYDEPADLARDAVAAALREHWRLDVIHIEHAPVGFGSHHWRATDSNGRHWFVTGDRLETDEAFDNLAAAYETAATLRQRGFSAAVAPIEDKAQRLLTRITPVWGLAVLDHIEGVACGNGPWPAGSRSIDAAVIVGRLHVATPPAGLRRFDFMIEHSAEVFATALAPTGPYTERARDLVALHRSSIEALLARYAALVAEISTDPMPWVVSHGEPHSGNFIAGNDGYLHLIDWDTVRLAPPERDLTGLPMQEPEVLAAYLEVGDLQPPRPHAIELFEAWWAICEIAIYAHYFRTPHEDAEDSRVSWGGLQENVEAAVRWPERVTP